MNNKKFIELYKEYRKNAKESFLILGILLLLFSLISPTIAVISIIILGLWTSIDLQRYIYFSEKGIKLKEIKGDN